MKNIKKTIATALVGAALLGGVGATYANWQVSDSAPIGTIKTGNMTVGVDDARTWSAISMPGWGQLGAIDLADYYLVPGIMLRGSFPVSADLVGQHLTATASFGLDSMTVAEDGVVWYNNKPTNISVRVLGPDVQLSDTVGIDRDLLVEVEFARTATNNSDDMDVVANLGSLTLTVTQNR